MSPTRVEAGNGESVVSPGINHGNRSRLTKSSGKLHSLLCRTSGGSDQDVCTSARATSRCGALVTVNSCILSQDAWPWRSELRSTVLSASSHSAVEAGRSRPSRLRHTPRFLSALAPRGWLCLPLAGGASQRHLYRTPVFGSRWMPARPFG
jgi:hypothetical protein